MLQTMTNEQILSAAHSDIVRQIENGRFKGLNEASDNEENFYTIVSLYAQWGNDPVEAEEELWKMFEQNFGEYLRGW